MKKLFHWPVLAICAGCIVLALIALIPFFQSSHTHAAHASGSASITISPTAGPPGSIAQVSGQNFVPNDTINIYEWQINGTLLGTATADASGNLPPTNITIPDEPENTITIIAAQVNQQVQASTTFTIEAEMSLSTTTLYPGQKVTFSAKGFPTYSYTQLYLDNTNGNYFTSFGGNDNGDFSLQIAMPTSSVTQGQHTVIAQVFANQTNYQLLSVPVTFLPHVNWITGIPGMSTQLTGAAFNANETVSIYWGTEKGQLEGTPTTDATGNLSFTFTPPSGLTPGQYPITVVRQQQKPAKVVAYFKVNPVTMTSTPGIRGEQRVYVHITGFLPDETITLSWSANGGQTLATGYADQKGSFKTTLYSLSAPPGTYTLTAVGATSGLQVSNPLSIGPGISISGSVPGGTTNVNGGGFAANETVNVYIFSPTKGVTATTDATGSFSVLITLPPVYHPSTKLYAHAVGSNGIDHASTPVTYIPAEFVPQSNSMYFGQTVTFSAQGYGANEAVNLVWNYQQSNQYTLDTITADLNGNFVVTVPVPSTPVQGNIPIAAIGTTSQITLTTTVQNYAAITLNPVSGKAGTKVTVSGGSFGSAISIQLLLQNSPLPVQVTSKHDGTFTATFKVPTITGAGNLTVEAIDQVNGISATTPFYYVPTLKASPTIIKSGGTVTLSGVHFAANSTVAISSCQNVNLSVNTDANGIFTTTMPVTGPAGPCTVTAQDNWTGLYVSTTFVIES